jgi:hypothetical protein
MNILGRFGGYKDLGSTPCYDGQDQLLNVASETVKRYLLGEIDEDQDFDGLDIQCLEVARNIRLDPEWQSLTQGDRIVVQHRKVGFEGGNAYVIWLDETREQSNGEEDQVRGVEAEGDS